MTTAASEEVKLVTKTEPPHGKSWQIVPLLFYSNPRKRPSDRIYGLDKEVLNLNAIYGMFQFTQEKITRTIEAKVIIDFWHNFCGGVFFYSPQVITYGGNAACEDWSSYLTTEMSYANPCGDYTYSDGTPAKYSALTPEILSAIPNLNEIFSVESMGVNQAKRIMWDSLGAALVS